MVAHGKCKGSKPCPPGKKLQEHHNGKTGCCIVIFHGYRSGSNEYDQMEIKASRGHETNKKTRRPLIVCQPGDFKELVDEPVNAR